MESSVLSELLALERPLVCLDLETTGTDYKTDRIVSIGICKIYTGGQVTEWSTVVNPGIPIPKEASEVHGITDAKVQSCKGCGGMHDGIDEEEKAANECGEFQPWPSFRAIAGIVAGGLDACDLAGYNLASFDVRLLQAEFSRVGQPWQPGRIVDAFRMAQRAHPRNLSWFVEEYVLKDEHGQPTGEAIDYKAHDSLHDARQTLRGLVNFLKRNTDFPRNVQGLNDMFFQVDANAIDPDGKFIWKNGEAVINFGKKHPGKTLREVRALDRAYLQWILKDDFSPAVKQIVTDALAGKLPVKPAQ